MNKPAGISPRASVLIVCHRQVDLLGRCLKSLRRNGSSAVSYETLVLFNGTAAADQQRVRPALHGATVIESGVNLGFGGGNNRLAALATGELLVFLNDDAEPQPGWLDALVETADAHPEAGAVGSRILHPDGSLQEAGSLLWRDGSTTGVGRGLAPDSRRFQYLREVDYASACSLLVRRATFERSGGFDEGYYPGYLEDVDLCLAIRSQGERVLYQPRSVAIHHESQTGGRAKEFLILRGRRRLRQKWSAELARRAEVRPWDELAVELAVHRARNSPRRVLIVEDRIPDPGAGSGFGRMLDAIRSLSGAGYAVSLYPTCDAAGDRSVLQDLGVEVIDDDLRSFLSSPQSRFDAAIVSRPNNAHVVKRLRRLQPRCAVIYDAEALFHRRLEREAAILADADPARAEFLRAWAAQMRRLEARVARQVDRVVAVSHVEAEALRAVSGRHAPIDVIEGHSLDARFTAAPFERRWMMLLVAGWLAPYPSPNSDGLEWFLDHVLPRVRERIPWAELAVTGAGAPDQLTWRESPWLRFLGHVGDLAELYESARLAVVPVRYGAGIKNKALEAALHGVPVVATSLGAEGLPAAAAAGIAVADEPAIFADHVVKLLDDPRTWQAARLKLAALNLNPNSSPLHAWPGTVESTLKETQLGLRAQQP